jgi:precorrin-3B synthase
MSAPAASFEVKGWCPGALRPMESGDGLIVRIRPRCASVSLGEMRAIAEAAAVHGNGHIDLTRRANLQIRGVSAATFGPLIAALLALGLLDGRPEAEAEAVRNILVSPLAGIDSSEVLDMRPLARELADMLAAQPETWALPPKFAFVLDGGGRLALSRERADLRLLAQGPRDAPSVAIGIDSDRGTEWLGSGLLRSARNHERTGAWADDAAQTCPDALTGVMLTVLRLVIAAGFEGERPRGLSPEALARIKSGMAAHLRPVTVPAMPLAPQDAPLSHLDIGEGRAVLGIGVPFGSLEAEQLGALAEIIGEAGGEGIRLSPWRVFYIPLRDAVASSRLMASARSLGFVVDAGDPLMRIQACPGHPACRAASTQTRKDARLLAAAMARTGFSGTAHLSGCAKGCASSLPADLTLVGAPGGYRLLRDATARHEGGAFISPADIGEGILHG